VLADQVAHQLILQSPAAADTQQEAERQFIQSQIGELKTNISKSQEDIRQLDDQISKATSARQIQDARSRQAALQTQVSSWQATYAQLLTSLQRGAPNSLSVVEPAQVPAGPIGPRVGYNVLLAAAIGLVLAGSAAFLLEYIDDTLKTADDVHRALNLTILGRLTRIEGEGYPSKLVVIQRPRSSGAEAFRVLRTNLRLSAKDRPLHTLMVTSSNPQEGKSVTAANLAVALAQSGKQVILVDADLRHPTQHNIFGLNNDVGLTTLLLEEDANLTETLQTVSVTNLSVLPSGPLPDNPAELLGSKRMRDLIESLQQHADIVIFDSPPVMAVADTTILAVRLDGALLVVDSGKTRRTIAQRSKETLASVGARLVGVALNRMPARDGYYYSHYYTEDGQRIQRRTGQDPLAPSLRRNGDAASRMDGTPAKREGPTDTKPLPEESS
jgi:non-specific protein-tyrosine kinase